MSRTKQTHGFVLEMDPPATLVAPANVSYLALAGLVAVLILVVVLSEERQRRQRS